MRPQSEIRVDLAAALVDGPGTCRELAQRTGWSVGLTRIALNNMVAARQVVKVQPRRVHGVRRPVPVYARATSLPRTGEVRGGGVVDLIAAWAGLAPATAMEVAM